MNRTVFVHAYAQQNLGDDLFVEMLCRRYPDTGFVIFASRSHARAWRDLGNLQIVHPIPYVDRILRRLRLPARVNRTYREFVASRCEAVVAIGGSIFMEPSDWNGELPFWANIEPAKHPLFIMGSNFGPFVSDKYRTSWHEAFRRAQDVCFRDEASWHTFDALPNVRCAPDIVFGYSEPTGEVDERERAVISVISLARRPLLAKHEGPYYQLVANICEHLVARGIEPVLMGFCEVEGDAHAVRHIQAELEYRGLAPLDQFIYSGNIRDALDLFKTAKYVVATRFHAMILGLLFEKRILPITYSSKMDNVLDDLSFDGPRVKLTAIDSSEFSSVLDRLISEPPRVYSSARKNASSHFACLDAYLR